MRSLFFGVLGMIVMVALSVEGGLGSYVQKHALLLVVGGTFFILFIATPDASLRLTWHALRRLFNREERFEDYHDELVALAKNRFLPIESKNALISYAKELWEQGIDSNLFIVLISQKKAQLENDTLEALQTLKNLAKYPPGLGITGTVMGMIALFSSLDANKSSVGANIALAMTATFFGLFLSYVIIAPIADRVQIRFVNRKRMYGEIYKMILLINQNEPAALIKGEMEDQVHVA